MIEQFFKFCVVGGSGVFVDFGITYLCKEWLKLNKYVANSLGFLCASNCASGIPIPMRSAWVRTTRSW